MHVLRDRDYKILRGRVWVLVLATLRTGPIIVGTLMKRSHKTVTLKSVESKNVKTSVYETRTFSVRGR